MRIFILEDDFNRINMFIDAMSTHDVTIRTSVEGAIHAYAPPYDLVLLDHDLGGEQMVDPSSVTGLGFAKWLAENAEPIETYIHSYNPVGADAMMSVLQDAGWDAMRYPFGPGLLDALRRL